MNDVARVGDMVRRPPRARAAFVHALLDHFERHGWPEPAVLGVDRQGREILSYLDGQVAWDPTPRPGRAGTAGWSWSSSQLARRAARSAWRSGRIKMPGCSSSSSQGSGWSRSGMGLGMLASLGC